MKTLTKECKRCGAMKRVDYFHRTVHGRRNVCKQCQHEEQRRRLRGTGDPEINRLLKAWGVAQVD